MYRIGQEELDAIKEVFDAKSLFRAGAKLNKVLNFEKAWGELIGSKFSLCVSGGTAAMISGLAAMGIGPGDEVLVPAYTYIATALVVLCVGAIPVVVDVDETLTIDPADLERKITPQTKAVIPVHILGKPCNMDAIMDIAKRHNLYVLEDACQADGGSYKGQRLGAIGDVGAFSFNYFKIITAGEGGCMVTNDEVLYQKALFYHDAGAVYFPYDIQFSVPPFCGSQFRIGEVTGAIMGVQMQRLDGILEDLRKMRAAARKLLELPKGVRFSPSNDDEGDCATGISLLFDSEEWAQNVAETGVGYRIVTSHRHVFQTWDAVLDHKIGVHPAMNPYNFPQNQGLRTQYSRDMCSKSLDILGRSVYFGISPDWSVGELFEVCEKVNQALKAGCK